jgi:hypothetical protein
VKASSASYKLNLVYYTKSSRAAGYTPCLGD